MDPESFSSCSHVVLLQIGHIHLKYGGLYTSIEQTNEIDVPFVSPE